MGEIFGKCFNCVPKTLFKIALPQFFLELSHCLNLLLFHQAHNEILDVICLNTNLVETKKNTMQGFD